MTRAMWIKIIDLIFTFVLKNENEVKSEVFEFDGNSEHRFNGIVQHLIDKSSEKKVVNVTASSCNSGRNAEDVIDFNSAKYFTSETNNYDQWIKYDFNEMKIHPTHYSIRTRNDTDYGNLQCWCIEVSNTNRDDDWKSLIPGKKIRFFYFFHLFSWKNRMMEQIHKIKYLIENVYLIFFPFICI